MGKLVEGDDGLPVEEVGVWAKDKHNYLCRYIDISRAARAKYLGGNRPGATFIDPFCGPGRARVRGTDEFIDGGVVAAWKKSREGGSPFSQIYIGDLEVERRQAAAARLRALGAPVVEVDGDAAQSVTQIIARLNPYGLHFAFLDPFNLKALDFSIIVALSKLKRIDMLIHMSQMDLQRNLDSNTAAEAPAFDIFAPGWRDNLDLKVGQRQLRNNVFQYWRDKIASLGVWTSTEMKLLTASRNQPLYRLLLAARHEIAHKFWTAASDVSGQGKFDF